MRTVCVVVFSLLALIGGAACGGDDDGVSLVDGGGDGNADSGAGGNQIGITCTEAEPCPSDIPVCAVLEQGATEGFCTKVCGTTPVPPTGEMPTQPSGGNEICAQGYTGTAFPVCGVTFGAQDGMLPWGCALGCGQGNFTCPDNLTCDVAAGGVCVP